MRLCRTGVEQLFTDDELATLALVGLKAEMWRELKKAIDEQKILMPKPEAPYFKSLWPYMYPFPIIKPNHFVNISVV